MSLVYLACLSTLVLAAFWAQSLGRRRALIAGLCRLLWLAPLILAFFPQLSSQELPRTVALTPLHVLVDDSASMNHAAPNGLASAKHMLQELESECARSGCKVTPSYLSQLDPLTEQGYTPLSRNLEAWLSKVGDDAWVVMSDGGDFEPSLGWSEALTDAGKAAAHGISQPTLTKQRGLIVGFGADQRDNLWLEAVDLPPFSFDDKLLNATVSIGRSHPGANELQVQIQATLAGKTLATTNATFAAGASKAEAELTLPALPRGRHLIVMKALAPAKEAMTWDNEAQAQVEVMPNTVGVLHLLGSPSWDGRFFRRYLKSEPKYDLISFYILRDPWDSQAVSERELSLIPFPVARLFNEELPNFRVVILQNFTLLQFLQPEYQQNLVKFVKEGGGLLFLGGDRALMDADLRNSPLREILPFTVANKGASSPTNHDLTGDEVWGDDANRSQTGPWYDQNLSFRLSLAQPNPEERALANVYDDWRSMQGVLGKFPHARGLHHMENVTFKSGTYTPLLNATTSSGQDQPLAIASYPGKGRAIWIFSDSLWRLAQVPDEDTSREVYQRFMQGAMTWLMRQDLRKPLIARSLAVRKDGDANLSWQATLQGPAVPYFKADGHWQVSICDHLMPLRELNIQQQGNQSLIISGSHLQQLDVGARCSLDIKGEHPAFGSVSTSVATLLPQRYNDAQVGASAQKLRQLSELTGARLIGAEQGAQKSAVLDWLAEQSEQAGVALPAHQTLLSNHYWHFEHYWLWLLLVFMPFEVIVRRWPEIMWGRR